MFQTELFEPTCIEQYSHEGFSFITSDIGDVTFLNGLSEPVHRWFRLTPSYSPKLVRFFIDKLECTDKLIICDPFLGKGTTVIEAKKHGLHAIGIEINPLLKLVSEYALTWDIDAEGFLSDRQELELRICDRLEKAKTLSLEEVLQAYDIALPQIHNVFRWWKKNVLKELLLIRSAVWEKENDKHKRLYWLALCSSALDCANIHRNHPTISFDDNHDRYIDVWGDFKKNIEIIFKDLQKLPTRERWGKVRILSGDSTRLTDIVDEPIHRVITSPPYPNRFSYVHTTRPQLFFMEVFSNACQSAELDCAAVGGTWGKATSVLYNDIIEPYPHINDILAPTVGQLRPRSNLMCNYAVKYFNMMDDHIRELEKIADKNFRGAYVVGNSRLSDVEILTDILLGKIFEKNGFRVNKILVLRKRGGRKKLYETAVCVEKK